MPIALVADAIKFLPALLGLPAVTPMFIPSLAGVFDPGVLREMALMLSGHPTAGDCDLLDVTTARLC